MLKKLLIIFALCYSQVSLAQTSALLDTNSISAKIRSDGGLFDGQFEVPKGSGAHSIYFGNIWLGGKNSTGQLHMAGQTYGTTGKDFFYGPYSSTASYSSAQYVGTYNRVWKISKSTIDFHKANYMNVGYVVPASISSWTGNGNATLGIAPVLAPYFDANFNSTYDPANGDYPIIRGDQAIFYMVNDDKQLHTSSGGTKLGVEIQGMAYSFDRPADSALSKTVFLNIKIINRSAAAYDSVFLGLWTDMDIGGDSDDYVGSDSSLNMYYTYNGVATDSKYGNRPPAQGSVLLNYPMSKFVYFNNDTTVQGDPKTAEQYYQYLTGRWRDNSPITYGGTGIGGFATTNFMFSGDPASNQGWTEVGSSNTPGDRRGVMSVGPFSLAAGGQLCIDLGFPFACDYNGNNLTSVSLLKQRTQSVKSFYTAQNYQCNLFAGTDDVNYNNSLTIYPNPTTGKFRIASKDIGFEGNCSVKVFNILGETLVSKNVFIANDEFDLSQQKAGIYFIELKNNGKVYNAKIVVAN